MRITQWAERRCVKPPPPPPHLPRRPRTPTDAPAHGKVPQPRRRAAVSTKQTNASTSKWSRPPQPVRRAQRACATETPAVTCAPRARQCVTADSAPRSLFTRRGRLACPHSRCRRACLGRGHVCSAGREAFTQGLQRTCVGAEARSATCKLTLQPAAPQHANKHRDRMRVRGPAIRRHNYATRKKTHRVAPRPPRGGPLRPLLPLSRVSTDVHRADSHTPRLQQRQDQRSGEQEGHPRPPTAESSRAT